MVLEAANSDTLPAFRAASRNETNEYSRRQFEQPLAVPAPRLGMSWDASDKSGGLLVKRVDDGSPAANAGLRAGDRLLALNDARWETEDEFRSLVWAAANPAKMLVEREGIEDSIDVPVQLAGSPVRLGMAWRIDESEPGTVFVVQIYPGSPAGRAGIQYGDRIQAAAGQEFKSSDELLKIIAEQTDSFELRIERNGAIKTLNVGPLPKFPEPAEASEPN
jgi:S1-C subfamily serine protease